MSMLEPNTTYYWRVLAYSDNKYVASSPLYRFTTGEMFTYPLANCYWWEYEHTFTYTNILPPSIADRVYTPKPDIIRLDVVGKVIILDTLEVYALTAMRPEPSDIYVTYDNTSYMNNTDSGLYFYAYDGGTSIIPKNRPLSDNDRPNNVEPDVPHYSLDDWFGKPNTPGSMIYEDPPPLCLPYPSEIGQQWIYRRVYGYGFPCRLDKKFLEWTDVIVPAGTFRCMKIQWLNDSDLDGQWDALPEAYDYVSARGLVKRTYFYGNGMVYDEDSPNVPIGWGDMTEEYVLSAYRLRCSQ